MLEPDQLRQPRTGAVHGTTDEFQRIRSVPCPSACTLDTEGSFGPDRITRTTYDDAGQATLVETGEGVTGVQADEVATAYTNNGQVSHVTDAEGNRTTYEYDGHDRLVKSAFPHRRPTVELDHRL